ncbi:hypothetical protein ACTXT7_009023 [Hymenolepis weldensis]
MASGTVNGSNSSSGSANHNHNLEYLDMVNNIETVSISSQKKSSLVGSTPFDPKKSRVTVQRPGEQKAYQCGPNSRKNKKADSVAIKGVGDLIHENMLERARISLNLPLSFVLTDASKHLNTDCVRIAFNLIFTEEIENSEIASLRFCLPLELCIERRSPGIEVHIGSDGIKSGCHETAQFAEL